MTNPADMLAAIADEVRGGCANYSGIALSTRLDDIVERIRLSATASEKRVAELVVKYETDDPIKPTSAELQDWLDGECAKAVKAYRVRLNCGLRQAVDAMKEATP